MRRVEDRVRVSLLSEMVFYGRVSAEGLSSGVFSTRERHGK